MLKRILCLLICATALSYAQAQVTTSSITGTVKSGSGESLEGATVTAVHTPSNTTYTTTSKKGGNFTLPSLRIGGPYTLTINYVGQKKQTIQDFYLTLGEPYNTNVILGESSQELTSVVVTTTGRRRAPDKTGASTNITREQLTTLPTLSRSITDFTRLTPQANGTNFGGRDSRYNNTIVDGANLNNNFGLNNDLLPGGGNPISLDAFDEITVSIAPYDVRQSNFTGGAVNAVTKSGTNTFHGSIYGYYRDLSFNGQKVKGQVLSGLLPTKNKIYGATLGGPIIKDKLFFFISAEKENRSNPPSQVWTPTGGSGVGNVSAVSIDSLRKFSDFLKSAYGYETGPYDFVPNLDFDNRKLLGKIDWNISKAHKLTVKYSDFSNNNGVQLNAQSTSFIPAGTSYTLRNGASTSSISTLPNPRIGQNALSFANSNYGFHDVVRSGTFELNSNFRGKFANQLLGTMTKIQDTRTSPSAVFPFIEIYNNDAKNYMSAGYEPFSYNNDVINNVYSLTDNFTYFAGKHTVTAGGSYEYQKVGNQFMSGSQSYYAYSSLNDFVTGQAPAVFALTYSLVKDKPAVYSAELKYGQLGVYLQDEFNISSKFKLTGGVRIDKPIYPEEPLENPKITALTLPGAAGDSTHYSTGMWPKASIYWSPRVGFRYDVQGNKSLIIRGGVGIFTGRIPFVWLTNMPTNSGMYQSAQAVTSTAALQNYKFNPNPLYYVNTFPNTAGTFLPAGFVVIDPQFRFAQVLRNNLAFDKRFGNGWTFTGELLYTKDINAIFMRNANQKAPDGRFVGNDNRPRYTSTATTTRRLYNAVSSAIVLENTDEGYSGSATVMLSKTAYRGFYGSLAYTYSTSADVTANPGSTASSVWSGNFAVGTQNDKELYNSQYVLPHRIVGNLSYRFEYAKHFATTISLFYEGSSQGSTSFIYSNDMNGDGNTSDLLYIPKDPNDIIFVAQTASGTITARSAQEQSDAFFKYVENTPYLKKHKGQYAERNGAYLPWFNRVDAKVLQDIFANFGKRRHTLQVSLDIINLTNLINNNMGIRQQVTYRNPLTFVAVDANGRPTYRMNQVGGQLPTSYSTDILSTTTTWGLQLGLRYIF